MVLKKILFFLAAIIFHLSLASYVNAQGAHTPWAESQLLAPLKAPRLFIEHPTFDAGDLAAGHRLNHTFMVKNTGEAELIIESISTDCGCSLAHYSPKINPGESGIITISVQSEPFWVGQRIQRVATVTTNDPLARRIKLVIEANIVP
ncbi:MAG: DUF1573 domain-containing protein [Candidatus Adiutrix sp.]